jgi:hypothetical protein
MREVLAVPLKNSSAATYIMREVRASPQHADNFISMLHVTISEVRNTRRTCSAHQLLRDTLG